MEIKLRTKYGKIYGRRKTVVEPVFEQTVNRGINRFLLRKETGAKAEWSLITATHNLLKLWRNNHEPGTTSTPAK